MSVVLGAGALLGTAGPAAAHAELVSSTPADGESLAQAPARLVLELSESVELAATRVTITDQEGRNVPASSVHLRRDPQADIEEPTALVVGLPALGRGTYRVSWTTLSSDDLHVTSGVMVFGVGQQVSSAGRDAEPRPSAVEAVTRWTGLLGLGLALGAGVLLLLMGADKDRSLARAAAGRRLLGSATAGAAVAALAAAALPLAQAGRAAGDLWPTVLRLLLQETYGLWWWPHEAALVVLAAIAWRARRAAGRSGPTHVVLAVAAGAGLVAVVSSVLMGHGGVRPAQRVGLVAVESVHVLSSLLWAGSVIAAALVLSLRLGGEPSGAALRRSVLLRFGAVAVSCLAVAGVSGAYLAGFRVLTPDALVHSVYGRALLVKLAIVGLAGLLGLLSTLVLRPGLARRLLGRPLPGRALPVALVTEGVVLLLALGAAAALAASPPATGSRWEVMRSGPASQGASAADLVETFRVQPNRAGANFFTVEAFDSRRPSPGPVRSVTMTLTSPEGSRSTAVGVNAGDGTWVASGQQLRPGTWVARVRAARDGLPDAVATYRWDVPDPAARSVDGIAGSSLRRWTTGLAVALAVVTFLVGAAFVGARRDRPAQVSAAAPGGDGDADPAVRADRADRADDDRGLVGSSRSRR